LQRKIGCKRTIEHKKKHRYSTDAFII